MIRKIEEMSLNAWPCLKTMHYDGWILRFANGYTRRANSIQPLYTSQIEILKKLRVVEDIYKEQGLKTTFKITSGELELDQILHEEGYELDAKTSVQILELKEVNWDKDSQLRVNDTLNDEWLETYCRLTDKKDSQEILVTLLKNIVPKTYYVLLFENDQAIACGLGVIENGFIGLFDIVVDRNYRHQGYGTKIMKGILALAKESNIEQAYLQVMLDNPNALKLYEKLGFKEVYTYHYRVKKEVNYNNISKIYDEVRREEKAVIESILKEIPNKKDVKILDLGCGTGNYTNMIQKLTSCTVYGLDQSEGMLQKAKEKNPKIEFVLGSATNIPLENHTFDLVYMTDVIHHIKDLDQLMIELERILKVNGKVCISTQSHRQIDLRAMSYYFPETSNVDKRRYPDLEEIIKVASLQGLKHFKTEIIEEGVEYNIDESFLQLIEKKGYSMLHLITQEEYQKGLYKLREEMSQGEVIKKSAGNSLVWLIKE